MLRFNTIYKDPYVNALYDDVKIIDFLSDIGDSGLKIIKQMEQGIKAPDRPTNLMYVSFFFDEKKKVLFLLLADDRILGLGFPGHDPEVNTKMVLFSASSPKALVRFFDECVSADNNNSAVYYNIQNYLHGQYRKNTIPVE